jgi:hypothetical protein
MAKSRIDTVEQRRKEGEARNNLWANKSPAEQLASLDSRGVVAAKQRAKIQKKIGE